MARHASSSLTDAEARVMTALWGLGQGTVADVTAALDAKYAVKYSTVQTMLRILEAKEYVTHGKQGRAFIYRPLVDKKQARRKALRHLVTRLFDGSPSLLVLNVLEDKRIPREEIERLRRLLESQ
jgi:BlaI family transcriptional regulator, penicillinase repressor